MSYYDIDRGYYKICCYPECQHPRWALVEAGKLIFPICRVCIGNKLFLASNCMKLKQTCHKHCNIWYKYIYESEMFIRFTLYDSNFIISLNKSDLLFTIYKKDKYPGWYSIDHPHLSTNEIKQHTYKYILQSWRSLKQNNTYFDIIPKDILDEVIYHLNFFFIILLDNGFAKTH